MSDEYPIDDADEALIAYAQQHPTPRQRVGDWMQTYTGVAFYLQDPYVEDVSIIDIAHSLAMICRFGGHTREFYSVAEHCVAMSHAVSPENALWALLHDATEAYMGDMIRPLKRVLPAYADMENRLMVVICRRFDLAEECPKEVKEADNRILEDERVTFMGEPPMPWSERGALDVTLEGWNPVEAEAMYLQRFYDLTTETVR